MNEKEMVIFIKGPKKSVRKVMHCVFQAEAIPKWKMFGDIMYVFMNTIDKDKMEHLGRYNKKLFIQKGVQVVKNT